MAGQSDLALLHAVSQERDRAGLAVAVCPTELGLLCCSKADCCQGHCWYELAAVLPLEEELGSKIHSPLSKREEPQLGWDWCAVTC